jgi:hypothetical protein
MDSTARAVAARRTVAIWGSCVTRDAFAVDSRAGDLAARLPTVYYTTRTSWVSQGSAPWPGPAPDLGEVENEFGRRMVEGDLRKTVADRLVEHRPDLVVLDLINERFPLARFGRTWLTVSQYLRQTDLGARAETYADEVDDPIGGNRPALFADAVPRIAGRLLRELPRTTFVLHEAPFTDRVGDGGSLPEPQRRSVRALNAAQQPLRESLARAFGARLVRIVPPEHVCVADTGHRWGLFFTHYVEDYYHWLIDALLEVPDRSSTPGVSTAAAW